MDSVLNILDISNFNTAYTGKQGCACGCGGNYFYDERNFKRVLNLIRKRESEGNPIEVSKGINEYIVSYEGDIRAARIYTNQNLSDFLTEL
jgi:hypothetical protein